MAFKSWLFSLFQARRRLIRKAGRRQTPPKRVNLHLETLEDRLAPASIVTVASFASSGSNGEYPHGGLVEDSNGNLFGTTLAGGADKFGTVFEVAHNGNTITTLASFTGSNGLFPNGGLVEDSSGNLFGTTEAGGADNLGTVFEVVHNTNTITTLASFTGSNGETPYATLVEDNSGNLFGTTQEGGADNLGTVFEVAYNSSTITTLASFTGSNGGYPEAGLVEDSSGNLFGTTPWGGAGNDGTVFEVAHNSNTITALASFTVSIGDTFAGVVVDSSGDLFGTTQLGGSSGTGTVFEVAHNTNTITTLASFASTWSNGNNPFVAGLVEDSSGNLFGTTTAGGALGTGTVFEVAHNSNTITTLASFTGSNGEEPLAGLEEDSSGNLFGTTCFGGPNGTGTVFEVPQAATITVGASVNPVNITYGTPLANTQLSGTATAIVNGQTVTVAGTFTYTSGAGTVLGAGKGQSEAVTFTPIDSTDYTTATTTVVVNVAQATPQESVNPVNITYGTALANGQLSGTATWIVAGQSVSVAGTFSYTSAAGTVLPAGNGQSEAVTFTPADTVDYTAVSTTVIVNVAQPPRELSALFGNNETTIVGTAFGTLLEAQLTDASGNPLPGYFVTFTVNNASNGAGATFDGDTMVTLPTNSEGLAIAPVLTADTLAGNFSVTATVSGASTTFLLTNISGAPAKVTVVGGNGQSTPINSIFGTLLQVEVTDAYGNPVTGVAVTFNAPHSGASGTFNAVTTVPTNALGIATAPEFTANDIAGMFQVTATVSGLASTADFALTNIPKKSSWTTVVGPQLAELYKEFLPYNAAGQVASFVPSNDLEMLTVANGEVAIAVRAFVDPSAEVISLGGQVTAVRYLPVAFGMPGVEVDAMLPISNLPELGKLADVAFVAHEARIVVGDDTPPSIAADPSNQTVATGGQATFSSAATGNPTPTVQWQVSSDGGKIFVNIPGATSTTLTFMPDASQNREEFRAVFTNASGEVSTTAATLTVRRATASNALSGTISGTYFVPPTTVDNPDGSVSITTDAGTSYFFTGSGTLAQLGPVQAAGELTFGGLGGDSTDSRTLILSSAGGTVTLWLESQPASGFSEPFVFGVQRATGIYAGLSVEGTVTIALTPATTSTSSDAPQYGNFTLTIQLGPPTNAGIKGIVLAGSLPRDVLITAQPYGGGKVLAWTVTDFLGNFQLFLPPGKYLIAASEFLVNTSATVIVPENGFASLILDLSAGNSGDQPPPALFANESTYVAMVGQTLTFDSAAGLLRYVYDTTGKSVEVMAVNGLAVNVGASIVLASGATVTVQSDGSFIYVPKGDSQTSDSFTYTVSDGTYTASATVTVNEFTPWLHVQDVFFVTPVGTSLIVPSAGLLMVPWPRYVTFVAPPSNGMPLQITEVNGNAANLGTAITLASGATLTVNADGSFTYIPAAGFEGQDRFTFSGPGDSSSVTATIFVVPATATFVLTNTSGAPDHIAPFGGTPQSTVEGSAFGKLLQALVTDSDGNPVADASVTFAVPSFGPTGSFDASATVPTNALGIATAPAFTANDIAGTFAVTATVAGVAAPARFTLTNTTTEKRAWMTVVGQQLTELYHEFRPYYNAREVASFVPSNDLVALNLANGEVGVDIRAFVDTSAEVTSLGGQVTDVLYLPVAFGMPGVEVQAMLPIVKLPALGRQADVVVVMPQYRVGPAGSMAPSITTNPSDQSVVTGDQATFTTAASGVATPTVQWQMSSDGGKVFRNIPGATSLTLAFTAIAGQTGNEYRAVFTNELGHVSTTAATLTVQGAAASNALSGTIKGTYVVPPTTLDLGGGSGLITTDAGISYYLSRSGTLAQLGPVHAASELSFGGLGGSSGGTLILSSAGGTVTLWLESQSVSGFSSLPQPFDFGVQRATGIYAGLSVQGTVTIALTPATTSTSNDAPQYGNFTLTIRVGPPTNAGIKGVVLAGSLPQRLVLITAQPFGGGKVLAWTVTDSQGNFQLFLLPGKYLIVATGILVVNTSETVIVPKNGFKSLILDSSAGNSGHQLPPALFANGSTYSAVVGQALTTDSADGLLRDVYDATGKSVKVTAVNGNAANVGATITLASGATLTVRADGSFVYVPKGNSQSRDSFTYTVSDGTNTASATAFVNVFTPWMYVSDAFFVSPAGTSLTVPSGVGLLAGAPPSNGMPLQITEVSGSAANVGTAITLASGATLTVDADGLFTYVPAAGFQGQDSFTFTGPGAVVRNTATIFVVPATVGASVTL